MPEYRRAKAGGGTYFFTVVAYERQPLLTTIKVRQALRASIERARLILPFKSEAWVLLPDHLHCVWTLPKGDANFSARWGIIKRHVSRSCRDTFQNEKELSASRRRRKELAFWQRRFWEHQIRDEADFQRCLDYIHWNPVKHGLVRKVTDWPYSTFHRYFAAGVYSADWAGAAETEVAQFGE